MTLGFGLLGLVAESLAWTIGVGAVALVRFGRRGHRRPSSFVGLLPVAR